MRSCNDGFFRFFRVEIEIYFSIYIWYTMTKYLARLKRNKQGHVFLDLVKNLDYAQI